MCGEIIGTMKKILVITSSIDLTVSYIIEKYSEKVSFYRFDVDNLGDYIITIRQNEWKIINSSKEEIDNNNTRAIYYRKPRFPQLVDYENAYHGMIKRDIITLINGIVDAFDGTVLTKPYLLRRAENKVFQMLYSDECVRLMPKSFIGNSINHVGIKEEDKKIIKPLSTGKVVLDDHIELYQTNIFDKTLLKGYASEVSITPIYIQNYVEKKYEVRITIIGLSLFCVRIDSLNPIDWRADYSNLSYTIIDCPSEIAKQCFEMMKKMQINFGAFDYIVNNEDEWVFLEVNPNGQWLWLEEELGINISRKIVEYLIGEEGENR